MKQLEELGVGRPSTYASIIGTIQDRGYVWKKGTALVPSFTAFAVVTLLEQHFADLVDYAFTARMEDDLDDIASGDGEAVPWLSASTSATAHGRRRLKAMVNDRLDEIDARASQLDPARRRRRRTRRSSCASGATGPTCSAARSARQHPRRPGPRRAHPREGRRAARRAERRPRRSASTPRLACRCCAKAGRFGPVRAARRADDDAKDKPKTASLFKTMALDTVTLDDALQLLSLPRTSSAPTPSPARRSSPHNGRYGPYLKKGTDSRSLEDEEQLFTVTLDEAVQLFAEPKRRRGQGAAAAPLRELGADPVTGQAASWSRTAASGPT